MDPTTTRSQATEKAQTAESVHAAEVALPASAQPTKSAPLAGGAHPAEGALLAEKARATEGSRPASAHPAESAHAAENAPLVFLNKVARGKPENIRHPEGYCPFCDRPSLENILRTDGDCIWLVNKFRTLEDTMQTVLIESANHEGDPSNYTREENRHVFEFALSCWGDMLSSGRYASVLMYKNYGPNSGGTLRHPHFQIVGLNHKDGYERVPANAFSGVEVVRETASAAAEPPAAADTTPLRTVTLSTHPIMGFVEVNVAISETSMAGGGAAESGTASGGAAETGTAGAAAKDDVAWLADTAQAIIRYLLESYHGRGCTSYNLFFYRTEGDHIVHGTADDAPHAPGAARIICKIVPRWVTSPYFVGYRIAQVDCNETLEAVAADLRALL